MTHFEPILTQEDFDEAIKNRLSRQQRALTTAENDCDTWRRESRKWESRAKTNMQKIRALESVIDRFLDRFEDILEEEIDND